MEVSANTPAVVTGGASGLGEATARAIAAKGAKVAIFDLNEHDLRPDGNDPIDLQCRSLGHHQYNHVCRIHH